MKYLKEGTSKSINHFDNRRYRWAERKKAFRSWSKKATMKCERCRAKILYNPIIETGCWTCKCGHKNLFKDKFSRGNWLTFWSIVSVITVFSVIGTLIAK